MIIKHKFLGVRSIMYLWGIFDWCSRFKAVADDVSTVRSSASSLVARYKVCEVSVGYQGECPSHVVSDIIALDICPVKKSCFLLGLVKARSRTQHRKIGLLAKLARHMHDMGK